MTVLANRARADQILGPCRYSAAFSMLFGVGVGDGITGSCSPKQTIIASATSTITVYKVTIKWHIAARSKVCDSADHHKNAASSLKCS